MLLQLKSIPTLKILRCLGQKTEDDTWKIRNLKLRLPHISINGPINEEYLNIARPKKCLKNSIDRDWLWEIKTKKQDLFPSKLIEIDSSSELDSDSSQEDV